MRTEALEGLAVGGAVTVRLLDKCGGHAQRRLSPTPGAIWWGRDSGLEDAPRTFNMASRCSLLRTIAASALTFSLRVSSLRDCIHACALYLSTGSWLTSGSLACPVSM
jgi:hypothetical protein